MACPRETYHLISILGASFLPMRVWLAPGGVTEAPANSRPNQPPTPLAIALDALSAWQTSPALRLLGEGPGYFEKLRELALTGKIRGPKIHDARIASLCLNHGVRELWTADRDFTTFPTLRCLNPLLS
jgi:hypothetical protein